MKIATLQIRIASRNDSELKLRDELHSLLEEANFLTERETSFRIGEAETRSDEYPDVDWNLPDGQRSPDLQEQIERWYAHAGTVLGPVKT